MKNYLTLALVVFSAAGVLAQSVWKADPVSPLLPHQKDYINPSSGVNPLNLNKTDATANRVIGYSRYLHDGSSWFFGDSMTMSYGGARGSSDKTNEVYDTYREYISVGGALNNEMNTVQTWNASGKRMQQLRQGWDGTSWVNTDRLSFTYNAAGLLQEVLGETWNAGVWENSSSRVITYDAAGREIAQVFRVWISGAWVNYNRMQTTYDGSGQILVRTGDNWVAGAWVPSYGYYYTYNMDGYLTETLVKLVVSGVLENDSRNTYAYDINNRLETYTRETWAGGFWTYSERYSYTYDVIGNLLTYTRLWFGMGSWQNSFRMIMTYSATNKVLTELRQDWAGNWDNTDRKTYGYDGNDNKQSYLSEVYSGGVWESYERGTFSSLSGGELGHAFWELWYMGAWVPRVDETYYYENFTPASVEDSDAALSVNLFPNPVLDEAIIAFPSEPGSKYELGIFDLNGKLMLQALGVGSGSAERVRLGVAGFQSGLYLIKLKQNGAASVRRFVKL